MKNFEKIRFVLVGSGWRARYYLRIAEALPDVFECLAVLCRKEEKADEIQKEFGVRTVFSEEECLSLKPDLAVVAVSKPSIAQVSLRWMQHGITVLCETPAAVKEEDLKKLEDCVKKDGKLVTAEQYHLYPVYQSLISLVQKGVIGRPQYLYLSAAHEYHAASLIRTFLQVSEEEAYTLIGKEFPYESVRTMDRQREYHDGTIEIKKRQVCLGSFEKGKTALYDFSAEQYHSPIRLDMVKVQGVKGEIAGTRVSYLDENWNAEEECLRVESRMVNRRYQNPNLKTVKEIVSVKWKDEVLYEPYFGLCGLSEDESAMAFLLYKAGLYAMGKGENPYPLYKAAADARMAMKMTEVFNS